MTEWIRSTGLRLILAIGLSFALWAFVSFSENPDRSTPYDGVTVIVNGMLPGLVMVDQDGMPRASLPPVKVVVTSDATTLETVRPSDITAEVDLSKRGPGDHNVPVRAAANRSDLVGRLQFAVNPDYLPVRLEELITATVPLAVQVTGSPPFSFEPGLPTTSANTGSLTAARILGPKGRAAQVRSVRARVNIEGLRADYQSAVPLEPLDEKGQVILGITVEPATVEVLVPIRSVVGVRRVGVLGSVTGVPAPGYAVGSVESDPPLVNLTGSSGPLDAVTHVETEAVNVVGATKTISQEVAILLPPGTLLQLGEPPKVVVTIRIIPVSRPFQVTVPVPVQVTGVAPGLALSFSPETVALSLTGSGAAITSLGNAQLQGSVDVTGRGAGVYTLPVVVIVPKGVTIVEPKPTVTIVLRVIPSPTAPPLPTVTQTEPPTTGPTEPPQSDAPSRTPEPAQTVDPTRAPAGPETATPPLAPAATATTAPPPQPAPTATIAPP